MIDNKEDISGFETWRALDATYNFVLFFISITMILAGVWDIGITGLAIVTFYELSIRLKVKKRDKLLFLANQGEASAQFELGNLYANSLVINKDYKKALSWYRKSADQGYLKALDRMSAWHSRGYGTEKNNIEAFYWLSIAKKLGATSTFLNSKKVEKTLTTDEVEAVRKRVALWEPITSPSPTHAAFSPPTT